MVHSDYFYCYRRGRKPNFHVHYPHEASAHLLWSKCTSLPTPHTASTLISLFLLVDTSGHRYEHLGLRGPNTTAEYDRITACINSTPEYNWCNSHPFPNSRDTPLLHFTPDPVIRHITLTIRNLLIVRDLLTVRDLLHGIFIDRFIDRVLVHFQLNLYGAYIRTWFIDAQQDRHWCDCREHHRRADPLALLFARLALAEEQAKTP